MNERMKILEVIAIVCSLINMSVAIGTAMAGNSFGWHSAAGWFAAFCFSISVIGWREKYEELSSRSSESD